MQALTHLQAAIGNTPLAEIHFKYQGVHRRLFAKLEYYNFSGSIKDRMAFYMYQEAYRRGELRGGERIAEATSGNAGIAITALGRYLGHPVTIYMPDWMSEERKLMMRALGADLVLVSAEAGGFLGSIAQSQQLAATDAQVFLTRQFANPDNARAHEQGTAPELAAQLQSLGLTLDCFAAGVGTGGTVMGMAHYFKPRGARVHPMEPANSPTLRTGKKSGKHRIQGISDDFIPELVQLEALDAIIDVDDAEAIAVAQKLASELGLAVGISSGANFLAALKAQLLSGNPESVAATVFADDNKKYLSTDLMKKQPHTPESDALELLDLIVHPAP